MVAELFSPNRCHWSKAKVKNYNLNVTEFLYPAFSRNFQFHRRDPTLTSQSPHPHLTKQNQNFLADKNWERP